MSYNIGTMPKNLSKNRKKKIVVIGGGTGAYVVLSGLKQYDFDITSVVTSMDSGGSTGKLRDQYGVLPPGDIRQCLVALSQASNLWRKLFLYRFDKGDFKGHNFGNIFLTALEKNTDDYQEVLDTASYILKIKGSVLPVTFDRVHLCAKYQDGEIIETEHLIDTAFHKKCKIINAYLKPKAKIYSKTYSAIAKADYIICGPGDLYTSIIPNFLVDGFNKAINKSKAKIIYIVNLMTKRGQTTNYKASDHIIDLQTYLGKKIDYVLFNTGNIPDYIRKHYGNEKETAVQDDLSNLSENQYKTTIIRTNILDLIETKLISGDEIARSILRHDSNKLAYALLKIFLK